ncbi:glutamate formimidoyltransferase [candidate division WOR-3 bacterium 4484_100]|uniref:Formimidoyltransferase-cyclodeaminase n=1 Tax=candidate division WOR-3 bacterium 4484_100 TaxID=1936077 RepID=A0A1V4QGN2_UNCW3|nr:MAG: glutamate formimidoyltransferase [candidate division WOR-3 bacterium 4484_100]
MEKIIECIPNFSEGRDQEKIEKIVAEIRSAGVELLDQEMDPDHNRAVITFVGTPDAVLEAAFRGTKKAAELIDLTKHKGEHPRIGATDVIPFVPISNATTLECVELAKRLGKRIAEELKIPVYLYEAAATRPERQNLANIRKGEFEGLREEIETNPDRYPDFGEPKIHPTAGATVVGARFPLIAYNINLNTSDVTIAQKIAQAIRFGGGGFRYCKALGFELKKEGLSQVSINMTNYKKTPLYRVFETVRREAQRYGVNIKESEIVGLVPEKALIDTAIYFLQLDRFSEDQILEYRLHGKGGKQSLMDFLHTLALARPTPGGGSVAALMGALGTALLSMVTGITVKKTKDEELKSFHGFLKVETYEFYRAIEQDRIAFDQVMEAYKLPETDEQEKQKKKEEVQKALQHAAQVPFEVCKRIILIYPYARKLAQKGLKNALSDVGVALYSLHSGFSGARLNVLINLKSISDAEFNQKMKLELESLEKQEQELYNETEKIFLTNF